jgi:L-malate glycosyltransferase
MIATFPERGRPRVARMQSVAGSAIRVSFVIDSLSRAGTESQLVALLNSLDRSMVQPSLVLLDGSTIESRSLEPRDCPTIRLGVRKLISLRIVPAVARLRRFWREHRPDIVQTYFVDASYFAVPVAKWMGVRHVLRVRNNLGEWVTRKHRIMDRLLAPGLSAMLTNSDAGREKLLAEGHRTVHVLENGVDVRPVDHVPRATDAIITVANFRPVKNLDGLLRAFAAVRRVRPSATLALAGDGPERGHLESLRAALGLTDSVRMLGSIANVPAVLATMPIAVLPSHSEGMSNALLEMMTAGCAVIATDVGANRRVLGHAGMLVPPGDESALAAAMISLMNQPRRGVELGEQARARVEDQFSRAACTRRFVDFYRRLINPECVSAPKRER